MIKSDVFPGYLFSSSSFCIIPKVFNILIEHNESQQGARKFIQTAYIHVIVRTRIKYRLYLSLSLHVLVVSFYHFYRRFYTILSTYKSIDRAGKMCTSHVW